MDCHEILKLLTKFGEHSANNVNDDQLQRILDDVYSCIDKNFLHEIEQDQNLISNIRDIGWRYLHLILYTIKKLCNTELIEENPVLTVNQFRVVQSAIEIVTIIGILPQLKVNVTKVYSRTFEIKQDKDNILEKYKILTYTVNILLDCFDKTILRPALIMQLNCLLAALLQLSHALLKKPTVQNTTRNTSNSEFEMTIELYTQLVEEQAIFRQKLHELMINCPQPLLIKELMILMGIKKNPKWLQMSIKSYIIDRIMIANGVTALTLAFCNEVFDLGKSWDKLDVAAQLVATSHGPNIEKYYDSVCSQIVEMVASKNKKQGITIANCYIKAIYDYKPDVCINKIIHVIMEPILVKYPIEQKHSNIIKTENEVSDCIECLSKLFITKDAEFKHLPSKLLTSVALPLFYLYVKCYKSIYFLRDQVRNLLLQVLTNKSTKELIFSIFLNYNVLKNDEFGKKLCFQFGINGGLEIISEPVSIEQEELADCLFDLVVKDGHLSFDLFTYLLNILPEVNDLSQGKLLEPTTDTMIRIERQIMAAKLLTLLSGSTQVQKEQIKNPKPLLDFIKFSFSKFVSSSENSDTLIYEQDVGVLYTGLMLIKIILTNESFTQNWETFRDFISCIKQQFDLQRIPKHVVSIIEEIEIAVKKKGKQSYSRNYSDVSVDNKNTSEFDKALIDLTDPLLPVRAHGIITLTKLIEHHHPEVSVKKDFLLCIFQENLNHDDSFIYLAAINGICAMSTIFPEEVIVILVREFIGMAELKNRDVASETRAKLGEILVKTTRALGEMTPKYKSLLVNAFLTGTRDSDTLVRASSLSCLGEFCKIMGFRLGNLIIEILYCIGCIIKSDKDDGCRRAGVLVATLLLRGLGKDTLTQLGENLVTLYRSLKHLRDNDKDPVLQLHAQLALEEFDDIVQQFLFAKPKLEKQIFLLQN